MKPRLALLAAAALAASPAAAQVASQFTQAEAQAVFQRANDACLKDDYPSCIEGLGQVVQAGWGGEDVLYNLGTAHLKQGQLGLACLFLERALRLDPSDADAHGNLERAHQARIDKLVGANEGGTGEEPLVDRVVESTNAGPWGVAFLALWAVGFLLATLYRWLRSSLQRVVALATALTCLLFALPCGAVVGAHLWVRERSHEAIVVLASAPVREGPQAGLKASFEVHEGLKVRVLDQEGAFKHIRLSNGLQGWAAADAVQEIETY